MSIFNDHYAKQHQDKQDALLEHNTKINAERLELDRRRDMRDRWFLRLAAASLLVSFGSLLVASLALYFAFPK